MDIKSKRQKLMVQLVERKVRSRAQQLYETRGEVEGEALKDWVQAESEVLGNSILAPLYRRLRTDNQDAPEATPASDSAASEPASCETLA